MNQFKSTKESLFSLLNNIDNIIDPIFEKKLENNKMYQNELNAICDQIFSKRNDSTENEENKTLSMIRNLFELEKNIVQEDVHSIEAVKEKFDELILIKIENLEDIII